MNKFTIQSTGKDVLEREFDVKPCQYMLATTRHYSWPKGAGEYSQARREDMVLILYLSSDRWFGL